MLLFLIQDIFYKIASITLKLGGLQDNVHREGTVSQICYLGLSLCSTTSTNTCCQKSQKVSRFLT